MPIWILAPRCGWDIFWEQQNIKGGILLFNFIKKKRSQRWRSKPFVYSKIMRLIGFSSRWVSKSYYPSTTQYGEASSFLEQDCNEVELAPRDKREGMHINSLQLNEEVNVLEWNTSCKCESYYGIQWGRELLHQYTPRIIWWGTMCYWRPNIPCSGCWQRGRIIHF